MSNFSPLFRAFLGLLFLLLVGVASWRICNAQTTTICRPLGAGMFCTTTPSTVAPQPGFDPSVIREIPQGAIDPQMLRLMLLQKCIQRHIQEGLPYALARQRCLS